ncbi:MAG: hypothetical protein HQK91_05095 [Nitrospirae bacterium]|nr:hypothetical protein [Nitrospirota bacterium]MBF0540809.1 hypothetical protein [Nitrospirota bacterium]
MKQTYKTVMFLIILSFASWGRLLYLEGLWGEDWMWLWQYFNTDSYSEFIYYYQSLGHTLEGYITYRMFNLLEYFKENGSLIFNIVRFLLFTLNGLLIFFICKNIMHHKTLLPETIGALYIVSPIVNMLWIIQINRTLFLFTFLLSILLSIKALNNGRIKIFYYIVSIILSAFSILGLESFIFSEIFRPILFYYILSREDKIISYKKFKTTILYWAPYLLICVGILLFTILRPRFGIFAEAYHPSEMFSISIMLKILVGYIRFIYTLIIDMYKHTILLTYLKIDMLTLFLSIFAAIFIGRILLKSLEKESDEIILENKKIMLFGLLLIVLEIFPYAAVRDIGNLNSGNSRFALEANVGIAVFISSLIFFLYNKDIISKRLSKIIIAVIVLLGVGICNTMVKVYDDDWQQQRLFWKQLIWRIPDLKEGTFLVIDNQKEERYLEDFWRAPELIGPLNILYADSKGNSDSKRQMAYDITTDAHVNENINKSLRKGNVDISKMHSFSEQIEFPQSIVVASLHNGYLAINKDIDYSNIDNQVNISPYIANSDPDRILLDSKRSFPFRWVIGNEPKGKQKGTYLIQKIIFDRHILIRDWRYYYQKAVVLSKLNDFNGIVKLYEEKNTIKYDLPFPLLPEILVPFIQALYITKDYPQGSALLFKWAIYSHGSLSKALEIRNNILMLTKNTESVTRLDKDIQSIFHNIDESKNSHQ